MDIFRVIGIAVITAVISVLLKTVKPELAFAAALVGVIFLFSVCLDMLQEGFSVFDQLTEMTGIDSGIVKILLKAVGIGYLCEFASELLTDFGSNSLAGKVELFGKIAIFLLSVPVLQSLLTLISSFLELL